MQGTRQPLYSNILEDCKISLDSCYLEEISDADVSAREDDQRLRAESYLFFSILNLRERTPVISASQAVDSGFMLGYTRRCQNPYTGANPFLEAFRRGYIRVFLDDGSSSLHEYVRGCLRRDVRATPDGGGTRRFIFSSLSSVGGRSIPDDPRFSGDTHENRDFELVALYGDMLARLERGSGGLPGLLDRYYVWACQQWGDRERAALLKAICENFLESLSRYSAAPEKGHRLLPERAACAFATSLGLRDRMEKLLLDDDKEKRIASTEHLNVYQAICEMLLAKGVEEIRLVDAFSDDQVRALLHCLETINQVECFFETFDIIDRNTRATCVRSVSVKGYLGPWCASKLKEFSEQSEKSGQLERAALTRAFLEKGVEHMSRRSEMYNTLDDCKETLVSEMGFDCDMVDVWAKDVKELIDKAYKDVMLLGAHGSIERVDTLSIACAGIVCSKKVKNAYRRLRRRCLREARAAQTGLVRHNTPAEEQDLATSLCWAHFLQCKERMSDFSSLRFEKGTVAAFVRGSADIAFFRKTLPFLTLAHSISLFVVYVFISLADDALFNPQGWISMALVELGVTLPATMTAVLQSAAFIAFLVAYELLADRIGGLPSIGEVVGLWRSFAIEGEIVGLVTGVGEGVLRARDRIEELLSQDDPACKTGCEGIHEDSLELIEFKRFVESRWSSNSVSLPMTSASLSRMCSAAREMGNVMLRASVSLEESNRKGSSRNLVTIYDQQIQDSLELLLTEGEGALFLAEEGHGLRHVGGQAGSVAYIIDPIDGTANFVFAVGHSCVSIARVLPTGEVGAAVVYDPDRDECFWATHGGGAYCNGQRMSLCYSTAEGTDALEGTIGCLGTSPYNEDLLARFPRLAEVVLGHCADIRRTGSAALDLCYVAAGRFSVYVEGAISAWDAAAGSLIVAEAGGEVRTIDGDPLSFAVSGDDAPMPISVIAGLHSRVDLVRGLVHPILAPDAGERLLGANQYVSLVETRRNADGGDRIETRLDAKPSTRGVVVAARRGDEFLLLKHRRPAVRQSMIELPRGGVAVGETGESAARRELFEETGLEPVEIVRLGRLYPDSGILSTCVDVFLAVVAPDAMPCLRDESEDILEYRFIGLAELSAMIAAGELTDGFTLATLGMLGAM